MSRVDDVWDEEEDEACAALSLGSLCFTGADTEKSHAMRNDFFAGTMSMSLKSLAAFSTRLSHVYDVVFFESGQ